MGFASESMLALVYRIRGSEWVHSAERRTLLDAVTTWMSHDPPLAFTPGLHLSSGCSWLVLWAGFGLLVVAGSSLTCSFKCVSQAWLLQCVS